MDRGALTSTGWEEAGTITWWQAGKFSYERLNTIYTVWEHIQMQHYKEALASLQHARENWKNSQNAKVAKCEERQQMLATFGEIESMLAGKEYAMLQPLLRERMEYSKNTCETYFGGQHD